MYTLKTRALRYCVSQYLFKICVFFKFVTGDTGRIDVANWSKFLVFPGGFIVRLLTSVFFVMRFNICWG